MALHDAEKEIQQTVTDIIENHDIPEINKEREATGIIKKLEAAGDDLRWL